MRCLVTGVAGFIGSHLASALVSRGQEVTGIDCFADYYPRWIKERNLLRLDGASGFRFIEADMVETDLSGLLDGVDVCYHLAAQAGVRRSWGRDFAVYTRNNVLATQKLLEASRSTGLARLVFASSSSVYGDAPLPFREEMQGLPVSPYGLTKLTCEHLIRLYRTNFAVPAVSLRYFTVYGPGQRPDMAFHRFILQTLKGESIELYGDGSQTRDFTYIDDVVEATVRAGDPDRDINGRTFNIAGGSTVSLGASIEMLGRLMGRTASVKTFEPQRGDARHTAADIKQAQDLLDYAPAVGLEEGLGAEIAWIKSLYSLG